MHYVMDVTVVNIRFSDEKEMRGLVVDTLLLPIFAALGQIKRGNGYIEVNIQENFPYDACITYGINDLKYVSVECPICGEEYISGIPADMRAIQLLNIKVDIDIYEDGSIVINTICMDCKGFLRLVTDIFYMG
jgi:hypothetical protein